MEQIKAAGSFRHALQELLETCIWDRFMLWHIFLSRLSIFFVLVMSHSWLHS